MRTCLLLLAAALAAPGCEAEVASPDEETPDFEVARTQVELLPYRVRLARVAQVAGVAQDDPILTVLRESRLELGDHDYASGVRPDLRWSASRMGAWVKAILPVCDSEAMQARYPDLIDDPGALIAAAYGRDATEEDLTAIDQALEGASLDDAERRRAICLAILSSAEFVVR
ncbi:MAG TPA: hypothetical protein VKZ63_10410 [Kofleriaceae bacterium]|nr:hypothetical protein [Kofleriaceae bacterium]